MVHSTITASRQEESIPLAQSSKRIPELDGLRGLAILSVVLCHYIAGRHGEGHSNTVRYFFRVFSVGWWGVDLFFVLSGFLIGSILLESRASRNYFQTFYLRRTHRILPFYYLWILLYLAGFAVAFFSLPKGMVTSTDVVFLPRYIFFINNFFWVKTIPELVWLGGAWSLAIEEQFYLCAPLLIRYASGRTLAFVLSATILVAPLLRFLIFFFTNDYRYLATFGMPFRADTLAWGMLGAVLWQQPEFRAYLRDYPGTLRRILLFSFALVVGLLYWFLRPVGYLVATIGYSSLAFFFLSLLLFVLSYPNSWIAGVTRLKPLRQLGTISYCVYLIHFAVLYGFHEILLHRLPRVDDGMGLALTLLAAFTTCVLAAISWRFFEKPLIRRGHLYTY
jgi:peptidoglycan/LPS O-acetylase OafA/YrhL